MVMADRPEVRTASGPVAAVTLVGLAENLVNALARVPFRQPWRGPSGAVQNTGANLTREVIRSFMGYSTGLPIEEFRSMERSLDSLCKVVLPPWVTWRDQVHLETHRHRRRAGDLGPAPERTRRRHDPLPPRGWLHRHLADDVRRLRRGDGRRHRAARPSWPTTGSPPSSRTRPASTTPSTSTRCCWTATSTRPPSSWPGTPAAAGWPPRWCEELRERDLPSPAALVLFSPEVDLDLDQPSVTDNADRDILPWNIPVTSYLHGVQPNDARVSAAFADPSWFPPTFTAFGSDEMFRDGIVEFARAPRGGGHRERGPRGGGHVPRLPDRHAVGRRGQAGLRGHGRLRRPARGGQGRGRHRRRRRTRARAA